MPEETLLKQAFDKCGEQLDRIIDAYERVKSPYVPTGFPVYVRVTRLSDNSWFIYKIDSVTYYIDPPTWDNVESITGSIYLNHGSESEFGLINNSAGKASVSFYMDMNIAELNLLTYNINLINSGYSVEWVDPSTLPQS